MGSCAPPRYRFDSILTSHTQRHTLQSARSNRAPQQIGSNLSVYPQQLTCARRVRCTDHERARQTNKIIFFLGAMIRHTCASNAQAYIYAHKNMLPRGLINSAILIRQICAGYAPCWTLQAASAHAHSAHLTARIFMGPLDRARSERERVRFYGQYFVNDNMRASNRYLCSNMWSQRDGREHWSIADADAAVNICINVCRMYGKQS